MDHSDFLKLPDPYSPPHVQIFQYWRKHQWKVSNC